MKILVFEWSNYLAKALIDVCREFNISRDSITWDCDPAKPLVADEKFESILTKRIKEGNYDFVISINYRPLIGRICHELGMKYVAWCCDCPLVVPEDDVTMGLETNYIFLCDYLQYEEYKKKGIDSVYYLPLGANKAAVLRTKYDSDKALKYMCDVSLVGRLYESQLPLIKQLLDDETKALLDEIVSNQEELYNYSLIDECVTPGLIEYMNSIYKKRLEGTENVFKVNIPALRFALASEVTRKNRYILLSLLGKRYNTNLYSTDTIPGLGGVNQCGPVNYETEMPYAFHFSKINLNPTLRCIKTGIPLRAFDIMGYGGFLMSNYQEELAQYYEDGKELVLYDSYEDAVEKATYYLNNESVREEIAKKGREKTLNEFTLQNAFLKILATIE